MSIISFDPSFVEEAVFLWIKDRENAGGRAFGEKFHAARSKIYQENSASDREGAFRRFYDETFRELGFSIFFAEVLGEFPLVESIDAPLCVKRVCRKKDECAELYRDGSVLKPAVFLRSECVLDLRALRTFLRHELFHLSDMVDPAFCYEPDPHIETESDLERSLVRERFRTLWDLYVHARMCANGWEPLHSMEDRQNEFNRTFGFLEDKVRRDIFDSVTEGFALRQSDLLQKAAHVRSWVGAGNAGYICPLCRFSSFEKVSNWIGEGIEAARAIKNDYPEWDISMGACGPCFELYRAKAREFLTWKRIPRVA